VASTVVLTQIASLMNHLKPLLCYVRAVHKVRHAIFGQF